MGLDPAGALQRPPPAHPRPAFPPPPAVLLPRAAVGGGAGADQGALGAVFGALRSGEPLSSDDDEGEAVSALAALGGGARQRTSPDGSLDQVDDELPGASAAAAGRPDPSEARRQVGGGGPACASSEPAQPPAPHPCLASPCAHAALPAECVSLRPTCRRLPVQGAAILLEQCYKDLREARGVLGALRRQPALPLLPRPRLHVCSAPPSAVASRQPFPLPPAPRRLQRR